MIPYVIHQTYNGYVPPKVEENIAKYAPQYTRKFYQDEDCIAFLDQHLPEYTPTFLLLTKGAHKADLFRYAVLYVEGGVYLDIKTHLIVPLEEVVDHTQEQVTTGMSIINRTMYQGVIAAPPRMKFFLQLMEIIRICPNPSDYLHYTREMYRVLRQMEFTIRPGIQTSRLQSFTLSLLQEKNYHDENPKDRYGFCCYLLCNGKRVIQTRYHDFPWQSP